MKDKNAVAIGIVILILLIAYFLLKKRMTGTTGQSAVRITVGNTGQDLMQDCTYADGHIVSQPVKWGPCPPTSNGFPLITSGGPS